MARLDHRTSAAIRAGPNLHMLFRGFGRAI
jgi:hypothetical protein